MTRVDMERETALNNYKLQSVFLYNAILSANELQDFTTHVFLFFSSFTDKILNSYMLRPTRRNKMKQIIIFLVVISFYSIDVFCQQIEYDKANLQPSTFPQIIIKKHTQNIAPLDISKFKPLPIPQWKPPKDSVNNNIVNGYNLITRKEFTIKKIIDIKKMKMLQENHTDSYIPMQNNLLKKSNSPSKVKNFGELTKVVDPKIYPYSATVKIFMTFPDGSSGQASGVMIDPEHVLTAGHVIYDNKYGGWATSVRVVPAYEVQDVYYGPFGNGNAIATYSWEGWTKNEDRNWDMAYILLDRPCGAVAGYLAYGYNNNSFFKDRTFYNPGYPKEGQYDGQYMYTWGGTFSSVGDHQFYAGRDSYAGQSGSGTYTNLNGDDIEYSVLSYDFMSIYTGFVRIDSAKFISISSRIAMNTPSTFDLIPLNIRTTAYKYTVGSQLGTFDYLIHNYSSSSWAGSLTVGIYLSSDADINTDDILLQTRKYTGDIGSKETKRIIAESDSPFIPKDIAAGGYYLGIILDVKDYNTSNNATVGWDAAIIIVESTAPSLTVTPTEVNLGTNQSDISFSKTFIIENKGGGTLIGNISKTADWITSITPTNFSLDSSETKVITIEGIIPSNFVSLNTDVSITSNGGNQKINIYGSVLDANGWIVYNTYNSNIPTELTDAVAIDALENKWIGTYGSGLVKFDGKDWMVYNTDNSGLSTNNIRSIAIDALGNKWIGTWDAGLVKYDGTNWTVYNTTNSQIPNNRVETIAIDKSGNKWIGCYPGGVAKFYGTNWTIYNTSNSGLPNNAIQTIKIDGYGNKWIGSSYGGLTKFDDKNWTIYNKYNSPLPSPRISSIAIDANGIKWIGTGGFPDYNNENYRADLLRFDDTNWILYDSTNSDLIRDNIWSIAIDSLNNKWIDGNFDNVFDKLTLTKFDGVRRTTYHPINTTPGNYRISSIVIDKDGNKWLATNGGLAVYKYGSKKSISLLSPPNNSTITSLMTTLSWGAKSDAPKYRLEVNTISDFTGKVIYDDEIIGATSKQISGLTDNTIYYWRVNTIDNSGDASNSSGIFHFKTVNLTNGDILNGTIPKSFELSQNYPNPFNPITTIKYAVPQQSFVNISIYNLLGEKILTLINEDKQPGNYEVLFDGSNLSSGVYFYKIVSSNFIETKKLILMR